MLDAHLNKHSTLTQMLFLLSQIIYDFLNI
jgi:hypothetical protein